MSMKIRKKAPVQPVHPVKAAHDRYMEAFANHAKKKTPSSEASMRGAQEEYQTMNNSNMGAQGPASPMGNF